MVPSVTSLANNFMISMIENSTNSSSNTHDGVGNILLETFNNEKVRKGVFTFPSRKCKWISEQATLYMKRLWNSKEAQDEYITIQRELGDRYHKQFGAIRNKCDGFHHVEVDDDEIDHYDGHYHVVIYEYEGNEIEEDHDTGDDDEFYEYISLDLDDDEGDNDTT